MRAFVHAYFLSACMLSNAGEIGAWYRVRMVHMFVVFIPSHLTWLQTVVLIELLSLIMMPIISHITELFWGKYQLKREQQMPIPLLEEGGWINLVSNMLSRP